MRWSCELNHDLMALPAAFAMYPTVDLCQHGTGVPAVLQAHHLNESIIKNGLMEFLLDFFGPPSFIVIVMQAPDVPATAVGLWTIIDCYMHQSFIGACMHAWRSGPGYRHALRGHLSASKHLWS